MLKKELIMNYKAKAMNLEELSFKINPPTENLKKITFHPVFTRQVKKGGLDDGDKIIVLKMKIESTAAEPQVYDISVSYVACYEVTDIDSAADFELFLRYATREMYQTLRSTVSVVTTASCVVPFVMPVNPPYFPSN